MYASSLAVNGFYSPISSDTSSSRATVRAGAGLSVRSRRRGLPPASAAVDRALVARAVAGDQEAFAALVARTRRIVTSCLTRISAARGMGGAVDAEDLRQAFYVKLVDNDFRILRSYRGESSLTTWIHTVASRYFLRALRRNAREVMAQKDDLLHELEDPREDQESAKLRDERVQAIRMAVAELPSEDQAILELLVDQESTAKSIAERIGISADGVRMRKMRIVRRLASRVRELAG